jgi:hypothetical protein
MNNPLCDHFIRQRIFLISVHRSVRLSRSQGIEFYYFSYWELVRNVSVYPPTKPHSLVWFIGLLYNVELCPHNTRLLNYTLAATKLQSSRYRTIKSQLLNHTVAATRPYSRSYQTIQSQLLNHTVAATRPYSRSYQTIQSQLLNHIFAATRPYSRSY